MILSKVVKKCFPFSQSLLLKLPVINFSYPLCFCTSILQEMPPKKRKAPATKKGKGKEEKVEKEEQEEEENVEETAEHEDAPSAKKQKPSPVSGGKNS